MLVMIAIFSVIILVLAWVFNRYFLHKGKFTILVSYSEQIGNKIVENAKTYKGLIDEKNDLFSIGALNIKLPVPRTQYLVPTFQGKKKVYLIKLDMDRYAYRIPTTNNEIMTYKRDIYGNIIMNPATNKPIIKKHDYLLCDDVIEPDVKHWYAHITDVISRLTASRKDLMERWLPIISITLIFLFAVITLQQTTKNVLEDKRAIMEQAELAQEEARITTANMNNLIEKITGTRVLENEENEQNKRNEYNNNPDNG
jgi:hypothetical protein